MLCRDTTCEHETFRGVWCACHIPIPTFRMMSRTDQREVIRMAALESDKFEVRSDGKIRIARGD